MTETKKHWLGLISAVTVALIAGYFGVEKVKIQYSAEADSRAQAERVERDREIRKAITTMSIATELAKQQTNTLEKRADKHENDITDLQQRTSRLEAIAQ